MSRYLGPIHKKARRLNFSILENGKEFIRRKSLSTVNKWKRRSGFALQLEEKQRVRFLYGLTEKQLRNTFKRILKKTGIKSENLIIELEKRLDNVVFRLGFAKTRKAARQLVNHGHILINNRKVDVSSYILNVGDIVSIKKTKIKSSTNLKESIANRINLNFLELETKNFAGKLIKEPITELLNLGINGALVVEYYNRFV